MTGENSGNATIVAPGARRVREWLTAVAACRVIARAMRCRIFALAALVCVGCGPGPEPGDGGATDTGAADSTFDGAPADV